MGESSDGYRIHASLYPAVERSGTAGAVLYLPHTFHYLLRRICLFHVSSQGFSPSSRFAYLSTPLFVIISESLTSFFFICPWNFVNSTTGWCDNLLAQVGERFMGPISIIRNWTFCLFYVMAELWGSVVVSVLFWGFSNQIMTTDEAESFYPLFGLMANVALVFSGRVVKYFSEMRATMGPGVDGWGVSLKYMMGLVAIFGLLIAGIYAYINK